MIEQKVFAAIVRELKRATNDAFPKFQSKIREEIVELVEQSCDDLEAYEHNDPASRGRAHHILEHYPTYRAVLLYRIAAYLLNSNCLLEMITPDEALPIALRLSAVARLETGIEIHPRAQIGQRFVIDHGWGTVIGETSEIGDDCYMLGCVTLGALGISHNPTGKRHPTIRDRVQIGAHARLLGNITINDDVFIGPYSIVTKDIHKGSRVTIVNQLQQIRPGLIKHSNLLRVRGVIRMGDRLYIQSDIYQEPRAYLTSDHGMILTSLTVEHHSSHPSIAVVQFVRSMVERLVEVYGDVNLTIADGESQADVKQVGTLLLGCSRP